MQMQKFVVNAVRQLYIQNTEQFCELVSFLVTAESMANAEILVKNFIQSQQQPFINANDSVGEWRFVEILSINPIISESDNMIELQVQTFSSVEKLHHIEQNRQF